MMAWALAALTLVVGAMVSLAGYWTYHMFTAPGGARASLADLFEGAEPLVAQDTAVFADSWVYVSDELQPRRARSVRPSAAALAEV